MALTGRMAVCISPFFRGSLCLRSSALTGGDSGSVEIFYSNVIQSSLKWFQFFFWKELHLRLNFSPKRATKSSWSTLWLP